MKRWLLRACFVCAAAWMLHTLISSPIAADAPTLYRVSEVPLTWAATPAVSSLAADAPDQPSPSVEEPPPEPEPEGAEPGDIFAMMYHDLTEDENDTSVWRTTPASMISDFEELEALGYLPLSIEDYISGNYTVGPDYYIVTFDDGYLSNLTIAEPLLRGMGIPAAVFVITGSTEMESHMSWDELKQLQDGGVITVYSHTHSHLSATDVTRNTFLKDVETSWNALTEHLDEPAYKILSYPNGAYTRETMRILTQNGYDLFVIQETPWWWNEPDNDDGIRILVRMNISHDADIYGLVDINRATGGFSTLEEKLAAMAAAEAEALAAERAARRAWMEREISG